MSNQIKPHNRATLTAFQQAVIIRTPDGKQLELTPSLARLLAEKLPAYADHAEHITEPPPPTAEINAIIEQLRHSIARSPFTH